MKVESIVFIAYIYNLVLVLTATVLCKSLKPPLISLYRIWKMGKGCRDLLNIDGNTEETKSELLISLRVNFWYDHSLNAFREAFSMISLSSLQE